MLVVGLDIGGANLKAATNDGVAVDRPFPLWKSPERLPFELRSLLDRFPRPDVLAVTMTGELADCYASKSEGVASIVEAVTAASDVAARFWTTSGEFLDAADASETPRLVAASNWHALATFCGRIVPQGAAILIDIGSTTTDIIPLLDGSVCAQGMTDAERLTSRELVYIGVSRTPLCAFGPNIVVDGSPLPLAAELFATTLDVHLLLGHTSEDAGNCDTADGRPATRKYALCRLARMLCADPDEIGEERLLSMANAIARRQRDLITEALTTVLGRSKAIPTLLLSGSGEFLASQVCAGIPPSSYQSTLSLDSLFAQRVSRAACAFAVARLAVERSG